MTAEVAETAENRGRDCSTIARLSASATPRLNSSAWRRRRREIETLRAEIREHDRRYYVDAAPTISDLEYDRLIKRLQELEAAHPELVTPDSPTQRVGGEPIDGLTPVRHRIPMLSMDNTYSVEELQAIRRADCASCSPARRSPGSSN